MPVPKYVCFDANSKSDRVEESDEWLDVNGVRINKPLVEKPISGEDHNIYIYYPRSQGGGSKRLFRKIGDRSAQFYPEQHSTRAGDGCSYLYEELLQTEGTDVKVYAVGPEYAHAEARKSPVVDGRVLRNVRGKEMRYPVILSSSEKTIARKVVRAFGQTMCGFDILRSNGGSFVCDVNGWASVKDSPKFWDDAAKLLRQYCLQAVAPIHYHEQLTRAALASERPLRLSHDSGSREGDDSSETAASLAELLQAEALSASEGEVAAQGEEADELLCVVAFVRHGDRTPKQKLKFVTTEPALLEMIVEGGGAPKEERKIKTTAQMERLLTRVEAIVQRLQVEAVAANDVAGQDDAVEGKLAKFLAIRQVLRAHPFHGINRKVQLKPMAWTTVCDADEAAAAPASRPPAQRAADADALAARGGGSRASLRRNEEIGSSPTTSPEGGRATPIQPPSAEALRRERLVPTKALFIIKWGGELTPLGETQATTLGGKSRYSLYPGDKDGVLRLHASYRHDLKIYSSDEGRVQMTAAAFAKGFLALEGQLTPILASLVSKNHAVTTMLDETPEEGRAQMSVAKEAIHRVLTSELPLSDEDGEYIAASRQAARRAAEARERLANEVRVANEEARIAEDLATYGAQAAAEAAEEAAVEAAAEAAAKAAALSPQGAAALPPEPPVAPLLSAIERSDDDSLFHHALGAIGPPRDALHKLYQLVAALTSELHKRATVFLEHAAASASEPSSTPDADAPVATPGATPRAAILEPAHAETPTLHYNRWLKLQGEFYKAKKKDCFDTTKIPDLYDNAMYDMIHNQHLALTSLPSLYFAARTLAWYVVPTECMRSEPSKEPSSCPQLGALKKPLPSAQLRAYPTKRLTPSACSLDPRIVLAFGRWHVCRREGDNRREHCERHAEEAA